MFSKCLRTFKSFKRNFGHHYKTSIKSNRLRSVPVMESKRMLKTTAVLRNKDPFEDLLKMFEQSSQNQEPKGSIFTKEPPISIKDLDGNPIEPIDIDAWKDPNELLGLFGNVDYLEKKVLARQNDLIADPLDDLTRVIHDEISYGLGNFQVEDEEDVKKDETSETEQVKAGEMDELKEAAPQQEEKMIKVLPTDSKEAVANVTSTDLPNEKKTN